jgi:hypothetical protein
MTTSPELMKFATTSGLTIAEINSVASDGRMIDLLKWQGPKEAERRVRAALRLKEQFSLNPWYVQQAENVPDYWISFQASMYNR